MQKNRELNHTDAKGESEKVAELTRLKPSALRSAEEKVGGVCVEGGGVGRGARWCVRRYLELQGYELQGYQ